MSRPADQGPIFEWDALERIAELDPDDPECHRIAADYVRHQSPYPFTDATIVALYSYIQAVMAHRFGAGVNDQAMNLAIAKTLNDDNEYHLDRIADSFKRLCASDVIVDEATERVANVLDVIETVAGHRR